MCFVPHDQNPPSIFYVLIVASTIAVAASIAVLISVKIANSCLCTRLDLITLRSGNIMVTGSRSLAAPLFVIPISTTTGEDDWRPTVYPSRTFPMPVNE